MFLKNLKNLKPKNFLKT